MKLPNGDITYMIVNNSNVAKKVTVKDNSQITSRKAVSYTHLDVYKRQNMMRLKSIHQSWE